MGEQKVFFFILEGRLNAEDEDAARDWLHEHLEKPAAVIRRFKIIELGEIKDVVVRA